LDEVGYLYFRGRMDDMIRRGGENINPRDVEAVLGTHPLIRDVAVVGVPDDVMGQEVKAVVVPLPDFAPASLTQFLPNRLPRFAWPRYIELASELPKTATQKIHTSALQVLQPGDIDLRGSLSSAPGTRGPSGAG
jgi:crotonobetaine/carnitine-CoA ligase